MNQIDLHDYRFKYKFKKGERVTYNRVIFSCKPHPFDNIYPIEYKVIDNGEDFFKITDGECFFNWWEIVPTEPIKKIEYWIKFYIWYFTKFKRL